MLSITTNSTIVQGIRNVTSASWYLWLAFRIYCSNLHFMTHFRISEAALLLGVSDDTVRRWIRDGVLSVAKDDSGRQVVDGSELAGHAQLLATPQPMTATCAPAPATDSSAS